MESRGGGWRASLTSFSPSVDSVTHPRTGTQTGCASTSLAVISNKRMKMALVKTKTIDPFMSFKSWRGKPLGSDHLTWWSNLSISMLRRHSAITHSHFQSFLHLVKLFQSRSQVVHEDERVRALRFRRARMRFYIYLYEWARKRVRRMGADVYLSWQDNSASPFLLV